MNRARLKSRYAYRPFVRYDVFPLAWRPRGGRVIGKPEMLEQLRLPETEPAREWAYEPFEESA